MKSATEDHIHCTAFVKSRQIASGRLEAVALSVKAAADRDARVQALVFDDATGRQIDLDLRGTKADVVRRLADHPLVDRTGSSMPKQSGPGRPRLGVVAREVTLLPRHWQWLNAQPGGASVTLRKLVDEARKTNGPRDRARQAAEAAYRVMSAMAGNERGYEDALRALFATDRSRFRTSIATWPADVRGYIERLADPVFRAASN
ncbi:MAG: DUF2239 family protein [Proteobacteria bacterium]|nr:DUF2239 family protein [Pseudomonadota bacterium]